MRANTGNSTLARRRRAGVPMDSYDRLPPALRRWLSEAALPWSPHSALRAWRKALRACGDEDAACGRLSRIKAAQLRRDKVWAIRRSGRG
ncbi:DUF6525 family protein [Wenxinia saemankumensis]|uniref:Uncharacterized protein n=1 Tax=Wenxinia saemankumensis TaxID=1447782 RepID=A0A1M6B5B3_9RHOB|nr:DUF6525 family protein [Wenxinia saemankumensis]SHI43944.1 hypothetical protein SAMN05444417_0788 [Wenxinia saemankumensis]